MAVLHLNKESFDKLLDSKQPMLVDFWATWCGPCRMLAPTIEELGAQFEGKLIVGKVDVDQEQDLAMRFGVMNIPTVCLFKDGQEVKRLVGTLPMEEYVQAIGESF